MKKNTSIKLAVGIPTYGGIQNAISLEKLRKVIPFEYFECFGHPVVAQARNVVLNKFLQSDCTHLLSLDGDIHFDPKVVQMLLAADRDLIGIAYARRNIEGLNVRLLDPKNVPYKAGEPLEVLALPLGCLMIKRDVLARFVAKNPDYYYEHYGKKGYAFCESSLNLETRGLECDGYNFATKMAKQGEKIWCLPHVGVNHAGKLDYLARYFVDGKTE